MKEVISLLESGDLDAGFARDEMLQSYLKQSVIRISWNDMRTPCPRRSPPICRSQSDGNDGAGPARMKLRGDCEGHSSNLSMSDYT